jgi:uncharacterized membrane protein YfcA
MALWLGADLPLFLMLGMAAGLLAGLLGVGGGLILVPALLWVFQSRGIDPAVIVHLAVGTSLTAIIGTSLASIHAHQRRRAVRWPLVRVLAPGIFLGAWIGAMLADLLPALWLQRVVGCFAILVGLQLAFQPRVRPHRELPGRAGMTLGGIAIGTVSAVVGIGGGSLTVPFLHWNNIPLRNAVATSSACGLPIALAGAAGFLVSGWGQSGLPTGSTGFIYWPALPGIVIAALVSAPLGAWLAHTLPLRALEKTFALLLLAVGVKLLL